MSVNSLPTETWIILFESQSLPSLWKILQVLSRALVKEIDEHPAKDREPPKPKVVEDDGKRTKKKSKKAQDAEQLVIKDEGAAAATNEVGCRINMTARELRALLGCLRSMILKQITRMRHSPKQDLYTKTLQLKGRELPRCVTNHPNYDGNIIVIQPERRQTPLTQAAVFSHVRCQSCLCCGRHVGVNLNAFVYPKSWAKYMKNAQFLMPAGDHCVQGLCEECTGLSLKGVHMLEQLEPNLYREASRVLGLKRLRKGGRLHYIPEEFTDMRMKVRDHCKVHFPGVLQSYYYNKWTDIYKFVTAGLNNRQHKPPHSTAFWDKMDSIPVVVELSSEILFFP